MPTGRQTQLLNEALDLIGRAIAHDPGEGPTETVRRLLAVQTELLDITES